MQLSSMSRMGTHDHAAGVGETAEVKNKPCKVSEKKFARTGNMAPRVQRVTARAK